MSQEQDLFSASIKELRQRRLAGEFTPGEITPILETIPQLTDSPVASIDNTRLTVDIYGAAYSTESMQQLKSMINVGVKALKITAIQLTQRFHPWLKRPKSQYPNL